MHRNEKVIKRCSKPFILKTLAELTTCKHTKSELCKLYSIAHTTVNECIKKHDGKDLINTKVKVETKDEKKIELRILLQMKRVMKIKLVNNEKLFININLFFGS